MSQKIVSGLEGAHDVLHLGGSVDEHIWMVTLHNRPETETGHPLPSFLNDQRFRTVVRHVEPNALVLADLGNLDKSLEIFI